jgi:segregation and condensation protein A
MIERKVSWWRKVLDFALGGIRSGFGLFGHNARVDSIPAAGATLEVSAVEVENPEVEEVELKQTSPQSEGFAADVTPAAKASSAEHTPIADEGKPQVHQAVEAKTEPEVRAPAEEPEIPEEPVKAESTTVIDDWADAAAEPVEVIAAEEAAEVAEEQMEAERAAGGVEPATEEKAVAEVAEQAVVTADAATGPKAAAASVQETSPMPMPPEPTAEQKTADKVAAALKARGEDAEQSPFSVIVSKVYDGPLDLLLDLIRKQDIDIYDIPIAQITAQFLAYVDRLRASDMDTAGEFIYTAALLIHIKSKVLLPRAPAGPEDAVEDPRRELVERLLEHERFKNAAQMLLEKQMLEAATWTNPGVREFKEDANAEPEIAADTVDLVRVFRDILERARNRPILDVQEDAVTVGQMIQFLARRLTMEDKPVALRRLLSHTQSERALIAMFLALLEMVRLQAILLRQDRQFSEIFIKKHSGFEALMDQGLANARDDWR